MMQFQPEAEPMVVDHPPGITFTEYGALTGATAAYAGRPNACEILLAGMISEVRELIDEQNTLQEISKAQRESETQAKEVGDILWYVVELAKYTKTPFSTIGPQELDTYGSESEASLRLPVGSLKKDAELLNEKPLHALVIAALRVVVSLRPDKVEDLYAVERPSITAQLTTEEIELCDALHDITVVLGRIAQSGTFTLSGAAKATYKKNISRGRSAHVLKELS
jgi:hypothetical protein